MLLWTIDALPCDNLQCKNYYMLCRSGRKLVYMFIVIYNLDQCCFNLFLIFFGDYIHDLISIIVFYNNHINLLSIDTKINYPHPSKKMFSYLWFSGFFLLFYMYYFLVPLFLFKTIFSLSIPSYISYWLNYFFIFILSWYLQQ